MYRGAVVVLLVVGSACRREAAEAENAPALTARIFCNNYTLGATHGCDGGLSPEGKMRCGPQGAVSDLSWRLVEREYGADVYELYRVFPYVEETSTELEGPERSYMFTEVRYTGEPVVVFEDQAQRVLLYPADKERPTVDEHTPRVGMKPR